MSLTHANFKKILRTETFHFPCPCLHVVVDFAENLILSELAIISVENSFLSLVSSFPAPSFLLDHSRAPVITYYCLFCFVLFCRCVCVVCLAEYLYSVRAYAMCAQNKNTGRLFSMTFKLLFSIQTSFSMSFELLFSIQTGLTGIGFIFPTLCCASYFYLFSQVKKQFASWPLFPWRIWKCDFRYTQQALMVAVFLPVAYYEIGRRNAIATSYM